MRLLLDAESAITLGRNLPLHRDPRNVNATLESNEMLDMKVCGGKTAFIKDWDLLAAKANYQAPALAQLCGVSLRTLQRYFQREYRVTVIQWLTSNRLENARQKLLTGRGIKEVAQELGYKRLSHFSRAFKDEFGFSPRAYRNSRLAERSIDLPVFLSLRSASNRRIPPSLLVPFSPNAAAPTDSSARSQS